MPLLQCEVLKVYECASATHLSYCIEVDLMSQCFCVHHLPGPHLLQVKSNCVVGVVLKLSRAMFAIAPQRIVRVYII